MIIISWSRYSVLVPEESKNVVPVTHLLRGPLYFIWETFHRAV
jgi:hypothetical protein